MKVVVLDAKTLLVVLPRADMALIEHITRVLNDQLPEWKALVFGGHDGDATVADFRGDEEAALLAAKLHSRITALLDRPTEGKSDGAYSSSEVARA